jgi:lactoylglutathione lyase
MSTKKIPMTLEHVAIWTDKLEELRDYYVKYFGGLSNEKYFNEVKQFQSYFISFKQGARLEIMSMPNIPGNKMTPSLRSTKASFI